MLLIRAAVAFGLLAACNTLHAQERSGSPALRVGFGALDITPKVGDKHKPVFLAGFGHNRKATGVPDPLMARAIVFQEADKKIAIVSVDVVGLFHDFVERVRKRLPGFTYVLVSSTHNHEGPDTLGLWGPTAFQSGVDPVYIDSVIDGIVAAVTKADKSRSGVKAHIGTATAPELLHDGREPIVKHDELVAILLVDEKDKNAGLLVQWNCHPETLSSKNTLLSADYVWATVEYLREKVGCPVVYLTGTVGGLMTSLHVPIQDERGKKLADGTYEKTKEYGIRLGKVAENALAGKKPVSLTPIEARRRDVFMPMDNPV